MSRKLQNRMDRRDVESDSGMHQDPAPGASIATPRPSRSGFRKVPGHPYEQGFDLRLVPEKVPEPIVLGETEDGVRQFDERLVSRREFRTTTSLARGPGNGGGKLARLPSVDKTIRAASRSF